jgi:hypothetical protein
MKLEFHYDLQKSSSADFEPVPKEIEDKCTCAKPNEPEIDPHIP